MRPEPTYRLVASPTAGGNLLLAAVSEARPLLTDLGLVEAAPESRPEVEITVSFEINGQVRRRTDGRQCVRFSNEFVTRASG